MFCFFVIVSLILCSLNFFTLAYSVVVLLCSLVTEVFPGTAAQGCKFSVQFVVSIAGTV